MFILKIKASPAQIAVSHLQDFALFSTLLKAQECQCVQQKDRLLLYSVPTCSPPSSPKPDDTAWRIPLQTTSRMVHFRIDWGRQHGLGCRRGFWMVSYSAPQSATICTIIIWGSSITRLQHPSWSCAFPMQCKSLLTSAEKPSLKWFEDKIASLYSALNPTRLSFGAVREISNSCCQKCSLSVDK